MTQIIERFKGTNKSIQFTEDDIEEYLLKLKYGKSETLSTLMLLYPSLDFSNKFHEDHMYTRRANSESPIFVRWMSQKSSWIHISIQ